MVELLERAGGRIVEVRLSGKLVKEDYQRFLPDVERLIREHGRISLLVFLKDFHGWTASGLWADIRFAVGHYTDLRRIALIGETQWERGMAAVCKPFTAAQVRFFDFEHTDEARAWIEGEQEARAV